jgi:hypothetical protein
MRHVSGRKGGPRRRGARIGVVVGAVAGAAAVSVAVLAVLNERPDSGSPTTRGASAATTAAAAEESGQSQWRHTFRDDYTGPVWITVESPDSQVRTVTIVWGAWKRNILHEGAEPVTYLFAKGTGPNIPVAVAVEPDATITFGSGAEPPTDAQDVNAGWTSNETEEQPSQ